MCFSTCLLKSYPYCLFVTARFFLPIFDILASRCASTDLNGLMTEYVILHVWDASLFLMNTILLVLWALVLLWRGCTTSIRFESSWKYFWSWGFSWVSWVVRSLASWVANILLKLRDLSWTILPRSMIASYQLEHRSVQSCLTRLIRLHIPLPSLPLTHTFLYFSLLS